MGHDLTETDAPIAKPPWLLAATSYHRRVWGAGAIIDWSRREARRLVPATDVEALDLPRKDYEVWERRHYRGKVLARVVTWGGALVVGGLFLAILVPVFWRGFVWRGFLNWILVPVYCGVMAALTFFGLRLFMHVTAVGVRAWRRKWMTEVVLQREFKDLEELAADIDAYNRVFGKPGGGAHPFREALGDTAREQRRGLLTRLGDTGARWTATPQARHRLPAAGSPQPLVPGDAEGPAASAVPHRCDNRLRARLRRFFVVERGRWSDQQCMRCGAYKQD